MEEVRKDVCMISFKQYLEEAKVHPDLASHGITHEHIKKFMALQKADAVLGNDPYGATKGQRIAHGRARNKFWNDESLTNAQRHKIYSHYDKHGAKGMMSETKVSTEPKDLTQVRETDLPGLLGKGAFNSMVKHPWMKDWSSYEKAWKHGVSRAGFHTVEMYPYMKEVHAVAGGIRPEHKLVFGVSHFGPSGKVVQVQKWYRPKEPNEAEKRHGPSAGWTHVKSWKKEE